MTENLLSLSAIITLLPLLSFVILIFFGKRIGSKSGWIGTTIIFADFLLACYVSFQKLVYYGEAGMIQSKFHWFDLGNKTISIGIGIDNLAAIMLIVVTLISFLVHLFSMEYMKEDKRFPRFYSYLGIFTFSMLGIVTANNFLNMYIFWELVGISSYLLIGFWYEKDSAANASKKAFITNRVGDFGFFAGIMILFATYGTLMFDEVFKGISTGLLPFDNGTMLTVAGILLFAGAIGKSAQFPLHVWLPDAMEGPTPVSALIHAATMVAAGVYLTARIFPMLTADALLFVAYIGAFTAFMAATIAITQNDFKRVLAYSTVSQLGYMIMAIGVGAFSSGFFHLVTHAWFKAALFLGSGSVIHAMHHSMHKAHNHSMDPQDIRNMGGLRKKMPLTYITFVIATLALAGAPLTSGFLSKDSILAGTMAFASLSGHWMIPIAGFAAAGMTAFYMFRLVITSFHGKPKNEIAANTHENNWKIVAPLILLVALSFFFIYSPNPIDAHAGWFSHSTETPANIAPANLQFDFITPSAVPAGHGAAHYANMLAEETHHMHYPAMFLSVFIAGMGILLSFAIYQWKFANPDSLAKMFNGIPYKISYNKWYFDEIYAKSFIGGTIVIAKIMSWIDNNIVDGAVNSTAKITNVFGWITGKFDNFAVDGAVNFTASITGAAGVAVRKLQTGRVQTYVAFVIIGVMVLLYFVY